MSISRMVGAFALAAVTACGAFRGGSSSGTEDVSMNVSQSRADAIALIRTQLVHHGYQVTSVGEEMVVTAPKAIPVYLTEVSTAKQPKQAKGQQWFLVVTTEKMRFFGGTKLRVAGYLLPAGAGTTKAVTAGRLEQQAIPITAENAKLFREVEVVAGWISAAASRKS